MPQCMVGTPERPGSNPLLLTHSEVRTSPGLKMLRSSSSVSMKSDMIIISRSTFQTNPRGSMRLEAAKEIPANKDTIVSTESNLNQNNRAANNETTNQGKDAKPSSFSDLLQTYKPAIKIPLQRPRSGKIKQRNLLNHTENRESIPKRYSSISNMGSRKADNIEKGGFSNYLKSCVHEEIGYPMLLRTPKMGQALNISFQEAADMSMELPQLRNDESKASDYMQANKLDFSLHESKMLKSLHELSFAVVDNPDIENASPDIKRKQLVTEISKEIISVIAIPDANRHSNLNRLLKLKATKNIAVSASREKDKTESLSNTDKTKITCDSVTRNKCLASKSAMIDKLESQYT